MSTLLDARYYYIPLPPVLMLLLTNLLGYKGPTIGKPVLCLESGQWAWSLDGFRQELYCLVEVPTLLPSPYKSPKPPVTSGEAGWTAGSMHLHNALGTIQDVSCVFRVSHVTLFSMFSVTCVNASVPAVSSICTCVNTCPHLNKLDFQPLSQILFVHRALGSWSPLWKQIHENSGPVDESIPQ